MAISDFTSKVRGCWLGKNIGGTLGAPFEGQHELQNVSFYAQKNLNGNPEPNDDLDLQLIWLTLAEYYGIYNLTPRLFGEYWINAVTGPWGEYVTCRLNCKNGFFPPLSGAVNNNVWKWSNGAWIRSELWACLFPGDPDSAIDFAWRDASCDHTGEGIYAEMFTAALESAAFVEKDLRKLIEIANSKIPPGSRIRQSVEFVCRCFDNGDDWRTAREKIMEYNKDLGWFQAPSNLAFAVIGLLYGRGDFGAAVCIANNCGDDTDCTAATAGAVMGILLGAENIPAEWIAPIGDNIVTKSVNHFNLPVPTPKTVTELTNRVVFLQNQIAVNYPHEVSEDLCSTEAAEAIWKRSSYELKYNITSGTVCVEYLDGPELVPGKVCRCKLKLHSPVMSMSEFRFRWLLPEGWSSALNDVRLAGCIYCTSEVESEIVPPEDLQEGMVYIPLEVTVDGRGYPELINVPFCKKGTINYPRFTPNTDHKVRKMIIDRTAK